MITLTTLLMVTMAQSPATSTEPQRRAVVLPLQLRADPPEDVRVAAPGVERALTDAVARHAPFPVVGRSELAALLNVEVRQQLTGCNADSCIAEVADALGAELAVIPKLDLAHGVWTLRTSLVERRTASALRRAGVQARSLDALVNSLDSVARQLVGGPGASLSDSRLAERLGTDAEGMALLRQRVAAAPDVDVAETWTDIIIERNRESPVLALLEAAAFPAGAALLWLVTPWTGIPLGIVVGAGLGLAAPPQITLLPLFAAFVIPVVAQGVLLIPIGASLVVAVIDALDLGRVPVWRQGCCRDETRVRAATDPSMGHRAAAVIAALGGVALGMLVVAHPFLVLPAALLGAVVGVGAQAALGPGVWGPAIVLDATLSTEPAKPAALAFASSAWVGMAIVPPLMAASFVTAVMLMLTERSRLVDEEPPAVTSPRPAASGTPPSPRQTPADQAGAGK
ncbi:MAG: hypothetical protein AB2A00_24360 [Myxococcota bacterium]